MQNGLRLSPMDGQIAQAGAIVSSIRKLQDNYDEIRQYYKTLFGVVTQHNTNLAREIAELLGHIQYQDVVRQRIERVATAVEQRNEVLMELPRKLGEAQADLTDLPARMKGILEKYLSNEACHAPAATHMPGQSNALPKFQLF